MLAMAPPTEQCSAVAAPVSTQTAVPLRVLRPRTVLAVTARGGCVQGDRASPAPGARVPGDERPALRAHAAGQLPPRAHPSGPHRDRITKSARAVNAPALTLPVTLIADLNLIEAFTFVS